MSESIKGINVISLNLNTATATVIIAMKPLGRNAISGPVDSASVLKIRYAIPNQIIKIVS